MAAVDDFRDIRRVERLEIAGPAAARIELRVRGEQWRVAADAGVDAVFMVIPELAREGPFRGRVARDFVLHRVEHGTPFGVGFTDFINWS